jgi:hypothetical protein
MKKTALQVAMEELTAKREALLKQVDALTMAIDAMSRSQKTTPKVSHKKKAIPPVAQQIEELAAELRRPPGGHSVSG